jgi:hypothetical protein
MNLGLRVLRMCRRNCSLYEKIDPRGGDEMYIIPIVQVPSLTINLERESNEDEKHERVELSCFLALVFPN